MDEVASHVKKCHFGDIIKHPELARDVGNESLIAFYFRFKIAGGTVQKKTVQSFNEVDTHLFAYYPL